MKPIENPILRLAIFTLMIICVSAIVFSVYRFGEEMGLAKAAPRIPIADMKAEAPIFYNPPEDSKDCEAVSIPQAGVYKICPSITYINGIRFRLELTQ